MEISTFFDPIFLSIRYDTIQHVDAAASINVYSDRDPVNRETA